MQTSNCLLLFYDQVETIGDAYMVAAGLLDTSTSHAMAITNMAFDMREEAGKVMKPTTDEQLQVCNTVGQYFNNIKSQTKAFGSLAQASCLEWDFTL